MKNCTRCTSIPRSPTQSSGTLFLAPPLDHSRSTLREICRSRGIEVEEPIDGILSIKLRPGRLEEIIAAVEENLSEAERRDTKSLILEEGTGFSLGDLRHTEPLSRLSAKVQDRWLAELIEDQRLTTEFQPIVRADDPSHVFAYECLLRGRLADGTPISPTRMYDAARNADLLFQLDRTARLTAIREAVVHQIRDRLFINFNPSSIYDPAFCLRSTIAAIRSAEIEPDRIVFEVVESDQVDVDLLGIMTTYRKAGFRVALDDLGAGYGSLNLLSELRPDFVKLDMRLIRDVDRDPYKAGISSKLLEMARKLDIGTIAEGIETPGELEWLQRQGVDFVQGFLIARPGSPPPRPFSGSVMAPSPIGTPFPLAVSAS